MTALEIYLFSIADGLSSFFRAFTGVSAAFFVFSLICTPIILDTTKIEPSLLKKFFLCFIPVWLACVLLTVVIPDKKTIVAMYAVPYVTQIEGIKDVPPEMVKFIRKYMADYINEDK